MAKQGQSKASTNTTYRLFSLCCPVLETVPVLFLILATNTRAVQAMSPVLTPMHKFMIFCAYFERFGWSIVMLLAIFGCIVNSFNIVIFRKLGLNESINVAFFGISCGDLVGCAVGCIYAFCYQPDVKRLFLEELSVVISDVGGRLCFAVLTAAGMVSMLITAYMAIQRCLCVAIPLKVKVIFTATRTKITIVFMVLFTLAMRMPNVLTYRFGWVPVPSHDGLIQSNNGTETALSSGNASEIEIELSYYFRQILTPSRTRDQIVNYALMNQGIVQGAVTAVIIICTVILWIHLIVQSKWRKGVTGSESSGSSSAASSSSSKETKVAKTVVLICTLYAVCAVPVMTISAVFGTDKAFLETTGYQKVLFDFLLQICMIIQGINISANFFIYYNVSTQFNETFNQTFSFHRCNTRSDSSSEKSTKR